MQSRLTHIIAFLIALGTGVAPAWLDPQQTWPGRIALTIVTALLLGVKTDQLKTQRNAILGGLALAAALIAGIEGRFTGGTAGAAIVGNLAAIIAQVRIMLMGKLAALGVVLLLAGRADAQLWFDCPSGHEILTDSGPGCAGVVGISYASNWTATKVSTSTETKPATCEALDGSGDLEPCAWQRAAREATERAVQEAKDKAACRAKGCRIHHRGQSWCAEMLMVQCREWFCDCDWKPAKGAKKP